MGCKQFAAQSTLGLLKVGKLQLYANACGANPRGYKQDVGVGRDVDPSDSLPQCGWELVDPLVNTWELVDPLVNTRELVDPLVYTRELFDPLVNTRELFDPLVNTRELVDPLVNTPPANESSRPRDVTQIICV